MGPDDIYFYSDDEIERFERFEREEYYYYHGNCPTCGGEYGDGWSTCTCHGEGFTGILIQRRGFFLLIARLKTIPKHYRLLRRRNSRWQSAVTAIRLAFA